MIHPLTNTSSVLPPKPDITPNLNITDIEMVRLTFYFRLPSSSSSVISSACIVNANISAALVTDLLCYSYYCVILVTHYNSSALC